MTKVVSKLVRDAGPAAVGDLEAVGDLSRARYAVRGALGSSDRTSSTTAVATRRAVASWVSISIPSRHGVVQAGSGFGAPSTCTMQTRQAPNGAWRSSKHSVGIHAFASLAA